MTEENRRYSGAGTSAGTCRSDFSVVILQSRSNFSIFAAKSRSNFSKPWDI